MKAWMLAGLFLGGCAAVPPAEVTRNYVYTCEDGTGFEAEFQDDKVVVTLQGGRMLVLPQMPSASGIRYATPRYELRGKGRDAMWTVGRKVAVACKAG